MQCFNHHNEAAIGICKSCGKGICNKCCTELLNGLACKNSCEKRVNSLNEMIDNQVKILSTSNRNIKNLAYLFIIIGLLLGVGFGALFFQENILAATIFISIGVVFIFTGILKLGKKSQFPTSSSK